MASASNILVIPHGSSVSESRELPLKNDDFVFEKWPCIRQFEVFSYHLALASVNVPMSEYFTPGEYAYTTNAAIST